jgi:hypothetical protein
MKTIKVNIKYDGSEVKLVVEGVKGSGCTSLTRGLEDALYTGTVEGGFTPEYWEENPINNSEEL